MISKKFIELGEYAASGLYEEPNRSLFYRKALGIRRYYENCELAAYNGEYLYPSGALPNNMCISPWYLTGMSYNYGGMKEKDDELAEMYLNDFCRFRSTVPSEHTVAGNMWTHSMPNFERILAEGLLSYVDRINKIEDTDMRDGLIHVIEGIKAYISRSVEYLKSVNADERIINALRKVPLNPAENIYEALVAWNFVLYLDSCDNLGCLGTGLLPYYKDEDVVEVIKNLYDNLDKNGGYTMALTADDNPLVLQCLEASKGKRRPMIELFVDENTPEAVWKKAFEVIRSGNGQPAFYNRKALTEGFQKKFSISDEDIKKFCGGGCTEMMLAGISNVGSLDAGINLVLLLERTINSKLEKVSSFEEFYECYINYVRSEVENVCDQISLSEIERAKYQPLPMRSLLIDDCIEKGLDYNNNGARHRWSIINFSGIINIIDSMLVIKDFVFESKKYSASELVKCLKDNDPVLLDMAKKHDVCFGCNNAVADSFANRFTTDVFSMLDDKVPALGEGFLPASIQFNTQAAIGACLGATPDGREKGTPLCDSLAAILGKDTNGPTALLASVTSLDLKRALGIPVLNFNLNPDFKDDILKGLIKGYIELGGIQMQITCVSAEMLQAAFEHPELHRNIIVRVGGYTEYFHLLGEDLQKMIINRTIQQMG